MGTLKMVRIASVCAALLCLPAAAWGQQADADLEAVPSVERAAGSGALSPLVLSAAIVPERALVLGTGGYDTARQGALFDSVAEVRVWGPIALRAEVVYSDDTRRMRPSVGARLQVLRQGAHGVDGTLTSAFKTEGFNEVEGEIETTFAIGRRVGSYYLLGNVAYGQDPEGNERDGELRASLLRTQGRGVYGLEARGRSAIGPQHGSNSAVEPRADAVGGLVGMLSLRTFALYAEVGPSTVKLPGADFRWGVASWAGVATIF
jgi:hypothetical protein